MIYVNITDESPNHEMVQSVVIPPAAGALAEQAGRARHSSDSLVRCSLPAQVSASSPKMLLVPVPVPVSALNGSFATCRDGG
jgi:hypothetical protein